MKNASKIMYTIGKVINVIEIVFAVLFILLSVLIISQPNAIAEEAIKQGATALDTPQKAQSCGIVMLVGAIIALIVSIVIFILATRAVKRLKENDKGTTPHVIMLVIGVFGDIFYFLGGLFGILSVNERPTQE